MFNNKPNFKALLKEKYKAIEWQSFAVGMFSGFILTLLLVWYIAKDDKPYDWCFYLGSAKSSHCVDLYDQAARRMQEESEYIDSVYEGAFENDGFR